MAFFSYNSNAKIKFTYMIPVVNDNYNKLVYLNNKVYLSKVNLNSRFPKEYYNIKNREDREDSLKNGIEQSKLLFVESVRQSQNIYFYEYFSKYLIDTNSIDKNKIVSMKIYNESLLSTPYKDILDIIEKSGLQSIYMHLCFGIIYEMKIVIRVHESKINVDDINSNEISKISVEMDENKKLIVNNGHVIITKTINVGRFFARLFTFMCGNKKNGLLIFSLNITEINRRFVYNWVALESIYSINVLPRVNKNISRFRKNYYLQYEIEDIEEKVNYNSKLDRNDFYNGEEYHQFIMTKLTLEKLDNLTEFIIAYYYILNTQQVDIKQLDDFSDDIIVALYNTIKMLEKNNNRKEIKKIFSKKINSSKNVIVEPKVFINNSKKKEVKKKK